MLKILQARLQQYVNCELPYVQVGFRKWSGTEILGGNRIGNKIGKIGNIHWIIEKAREFQKSIYFCFIDYAKAFDCVDLWITANCGKFFKRWEYQTTLPDSWEICMQARKE